MAAKTKKAPATPATKAKEKTKAKAQAKPKTPVATRTKAAPKAKTAPKAKAAPAAKVETPAKPRAAAATKTSPKTKSTKPIAKATTKVKAKSKVNAATKTPAPKKPAAKKSAESKPAKATKKATAPEKATTKAKKPTRRIDAQPADFTPYTRKKNEEYMNEEQRAHFKQILLDWKRQLMEEVDRTVNHMKDVAANDPDPADRATQEEEFSLELRTRDRERKLIRKIDSTIDLIDQNDYGYCESCGIEIGIQRLEARPTATQCIDCKTLDEIKERQIHG